MTRPKLLDTYCCGGGASRGYDLAGFDVYGVDNEPQPRYPYPFHHGSALEVLFLLLEGSAVLFTHRDGPGEWLTLDDFSAVVGSPPCQAHTTLRHRTGLDYLDLIPETRLMFEMTGLPWIIENVVGAPLRNPLLLCGTMFGLGALCRDGTYRQLRRHRLFESNFLLGVPGKCDHMGEAIGVYGNGGGGPMNSGRGYKGYISEAREAMGIDWLTQSGLSQALPPVYTRYLGSQLLAQVLMRELL